MISAHLVVLNSGGGEELWTPAELTTALWLDAKDLSSVTKDESNLVSKLNDKSGNMNHAIQTGTKRPTFSNGELTFDGTNDCMSITDNAGLDITKKISIAMVVNPNISLASIGYLLCRNGSSAAENQYALDFNPSSDISNLSLNGSAIDNSGSNSVTPGQLNIIVGTYDKTEAEIFANGLSNGAGAYSTDLTSRSNIFLGCRSNAVDGSTQSVFFKGKINEVLIISDDLSTEERQKIEGYLAHKFGIESNLPSNHPYKISSPTI
jgi:hypothetical protein